MPKQDYEKSQFLKDCSFLYYDEVKEVGNDIIFLQYLLVEEENHWSLKGCRDHRLSYTWEMIFKKLSQGGFFSGTQNSFLLKFIDFSFNEFKYKLIHYPQNKNEAFLLQDIHAIATQQGQTPADYTLVESVSRKLPEQVRSLASNYIDNGGSIVESEVHAKCTTIHFRDCVFWVGFVVVYYLKERYTRAETHRDSNGNMSVTINTYFKSYYF